VAKDFKRRFPEMIYHVYDNRAFKENASSIYSKDQIDLIHSHLGIILAQETLKQTRVLLEKSLDFMAEKSIADSNEVLIRYADQYKRNILNPLEKSITNYAVPATALDIEKYKLENDEENNKFDLEANSSLLKMKFWALGFYILSVLLDFFYYNNYSLAVKESLEVINYFKVNCWSIGLYSAVFLTYNFSLLDTRRFLNKSKEILTEKNHIHLLRLQSAIDENDQAIEGQKQFNRIQTEILQTSEKELSRLILSNPFDASTNEIRDSLKNKLLRKLLNTYDRIR
jgi:hypothetical protein